MSKYVYPEGCREISGFGGGYEDMCRSMVILGMEWLEANPEAKPEFKQFKNVYGVTTDENEDMENLQKAMMAKDDGVTGAMMQASTNHVLFAHKNGWETYIEKMLEKEKDEQNSNN